jgi:hypothetical protein
MILIFAPRARLRLCYRAWEGGRLAHLEEVIERKANRGERQAA